MLVWLADIRRIETAGPSVDGIDSTIHYEVRLIARITWVPRTYSLYQMQLIHRTITTGYTPAHLTEAEEAIEKLCRDFCDPSGPLSPLQVNPNPYDVFAVGVDVNNAIDDMFLRSFIKYSSRYAAA